MLMQGTDPLSSASLLRALLGAEDHLWSVGTLAAFMALPSGGKRVETPDLVTLRTADTLVELRPCLPSGAQLLAFETLSSDARGWNHGIAICLPGSEAVPQGIVRRIGDAPLFDLGLGQGAARALARPANALDIAGLTWTEAEPLLAAGPATWIIDTPVLRVERQTPAGPGFHAVGQALATGRSHAETTPVPPGLIPVAHIFPPHPARHRPGAPMAFDFARHAQFQSILARHGRPDLWALKSETLAQLAAGRCDPPETDRHGAAVIRVTLRQHLHLHGPPPPDWLHRFDRPLLRALEAGEA
ncbi:hypothetical protein MASR1M32_31450 [Rhodobacter sp.]